MKTLYNKNKKIRNASGKKAPKIKIKYLIDILMIMMYLILPYFTSSSPIYFNSCINSNLKWKEMDENTFISLELFKILCKSKIHKSK